MSFMLPDVNLTNAVVGQKGIIPLQNMGISAGGVSANPAFLDNPPTLYIHNDSGCGLGMAFKDSGQSFNLPAGAWVPVPVLPGESELDYIVKYILPSPPVSLLMMAYYAPGEPIPQTSTLGNSPVGIGGSVSTSGNSLSNEGNASNIEVIDIGTVSNAKLIDIFTDHFLWNVEQSGIKHQVAKGNISGNPLQLGQAGDTTEVLGKLLLDQIATTGPVSPPTGTGTVSVLEFMVGSLKLLVISQTNLKNTSASQFTAALPTAFTSHAYIWTGDTTNIEFLLSGVAQSINVLSSLAAGAVGGRTAETVLQTANQGSLDTGTGFDTVRFQASNGAAHNGVVCVIGE